MMTLNRSLLGRMARVLRELSGYRGYLPYDIGDLLAEYDASCNDHVKVIKGIAQVGQRIRITKQFSTTSTGYQPGDEGTVIGTGIDEIRVCFDICRAAFGIKLFVPHDHYEIVTNPPAINTGD